MARVLLEHERMMNAVRLTATSADLNIMRKARLYKSAPMSIERDVSILTLMAE
jgi:hypothetical protein